MPFVPPGILAAIALFNFRNRRADLVVMKQSIFHEGPLQDIKRFSSSPDFDGAFLVNKIHYTRHGQVEIEFDDSIILVPWNEVELLQRKRRSLIVGVTHTFLK
jgi:hypothetical protein